MNFTSRDGNEINGVKVFIAYPDENTYGDVAESKFIQRNVCLKCGRLVYDTRTRIASVDGAPVALTRKETGVLEYLMLHEGRPVSQEELIEHVWDGSVDSFSNSIRVHISALRRKLRAALGYDPVVNRVGEGYVIGGDDK